MSDHYCKNLLPNGMCRKTGKLCEDALPSNAPELELPNWLSPENIPLACRTCSNHPSNGGTGICFCTLGSMEFTSGTSTGNDIQYTTTTNIAED